MLCRVDVTLMLTELKFQVCAFSFLYSWCVVSNCRLIFLLATLALCRAVFESSSTLLSVDLQLQLHNLFHQQLAVFQPDS